MRSFLSAFIFASLLSRATPSLSEVPSDEAIGRVAQGPEPSRLLDVVPKQGLHADASATRKAVAPRRESFGEPQVTLVLQQRDLP